MRASLPAPPNVLVLGDAAVVRGPAAIDAYRLLVVGVESVKRTDGISPSERLLQTLAAFKVAADAARCSLDSGVKEPGNVRGRPVSAALKASDQLGAEEVADLLGYSVQHVRRLGSQLGGHKLPRRPWVFPRAGVEAFLLERNQQESA